MKINNKFLDTLTKKLKFFNQVDWSTVLNSKDLLWLQSVQKTENQKHKFHLVSRSPWPILASMAGSSFLVGLLFWLHKVSTFLPLLLLGFILICLAMYLWFRDIIREGTYLGYHTKIVQRGLRIGFILFLISEVMFFFSFFWAYFHSSLNPSIWIGAVWPPEGIVHFFTEKSVTEAYFNLLTLVPNSMEPRLILFDANSEGGRLVYKNKYNGHFKTYDNYPEVFKTTPELIELRHDVGIATALYSEFIDNLGLNFTFLAKKKIREHELELVYRRLFNNNIKSKYLDYAIKKGKFKMHEESVLRAADLFAECKALQFQVSPDEPIKNFTLFNTFIEKYPYDSELIFKDKILSLLNPQTTDHFAREKSKTELALKILTNDDAHAGLENSFGYIEFRYFADVFTQRARFDQKPFFPSFVDYLLLSRRYDFFRSVVTNLVTPILKNDSTVDPEIANIFIKQFKNICIQHLVVNSNPIVDELEQDLIITHFAFLNYENIVFADAIFRNVGLGAIDTIAAVPPLSFFFLSNPYSLDLKTTRSDFRDVDILSDRIDFRTSERHRKTLLSYLFLDAKENLIEIEQAADENVERSDHSFDNYCGNDCIESFLHSDFYAQLSWIMFRIKHSPYSGLKFIRRYQTKLVTKIALDFIAGFKNNYDLYTDIIINSGLDESKFFNIYNDTMDFMLRGLYEESNMFQEIMINNIYHNADFYDKSADYANPFVFFITDFSISSAIWNFIAAGHSLKIIKQANSLTAHAIIGRFTLPELADTTIFPRASIKYEFRLFDHGCLINPSGVPWLNTILLITSGMTVTVSHIFFKARRLNWSISFLFLTIVLSIFFLKTQCLEYIHSSFAINDSVYGSAFYMLTGFHGFHVIVGTIFLIVCLVRLFLNHFHKNGHLGFEAAIWYWHFVDVIWIGLYFFVYFWPNNYFFHSHYIHNHSSTPNFKVEELSYSCPIRSIELFSRPKEWLDESIRSLGTIDYYSGYKDFHLPCGQSSKCLLIFSLYKYDLKLDGLLCNMFVFSRKEVDLDWIRVSHQVRERVENKGIISWYVKYRRMGLYEGTLQEEWKHSYFKYCDNKILYNPRWTNRKKNYWEAY